LIGEGLSHFCFGAIGLGLFLGFYPLYFSLPFTILASLWIQYLSEKNPIEVDTAIGMISSLGVALGIMMASLGEGFNIDLFSYLFGDILAISQFEVLITFVLCIIILLFISLFYHDLFALTFDEEFSKILGIKAQVINRVLVVLTAVTVVSGIKVVGTLLVSSLIILPSATSLQLAKSFKALLFTSTLLACFSVIIGIFLAYFFNLPAGASIVLLNFSFFILANFISRFR